MFAYRLLSANRTASLTHLKRIADFLELGPGRWYKVHETAIEFLDGFEEQDTNEQGPTRTHFRYL